MTRRTGEVVHAEWGHGLTLLPTSTPISWQKQSAGSPILKVFEMPPLGVGRANEMHTVAIKLYFSLSIFLTYALLSLSLIRFSPMPCILKFMYMRYPKQIHFLPPSIHCVLPLQKPISYTMWSSFQVVG